MSSKSIYSPRLPPASLYVEIHLCSPLPLATLVDLPISVAATTYWRDFLILTPYNILQLLQMRQAKLRTVI